MEEDLDLFFRLEVARVRRHREPLPARRLGPRCVVRRAAAPGQAAMGCAM